MNLMGLSAKNMPMRMLGVMDRALGVNAPVAQVGDVCELMLAGRSMPEACHFGRLGCRFGRYIAVKDPV